MPIFYNNPKSNPISLTWSFQDSGTDPYYYTSFKDHSAKISNSHDGRYHLTISHFQNWHSIDIVLDSYEECDTYVLEYIKNQGLNV